jgi:protein ImuA
VNKEMNTPFKLNLKTLPGGVSGLAPARAPLGHAEADACLCGGLLPGAVHEVFAAMAGAGAAASGFALALALRALAKSKWLLWVRQDFAGLELGEIHADGLHDFGADPSRVLLLRAPDANAVLRGGAEGLGCKGLGAVIVEPWGPAPMFNLTASRRLLLAAGRHGITVIVLRHGCAPAPSAAETRWLIRPAPLAPDDGNQGIPLFDAALLRNRHGSTGRWMMEWDCNNGIFRTAHSRASVSPFAGRSAEAPLEGLRQAG